MSHSQTTKWPGKRRVAVAESKTEPRGNIFTACQLLSCAKRGNRCLSVCPVRLLHNFNTNGPTITRFLSNGSPKTLVFGDVKILRKLKDITPAKQFSASRPITIRKVRR